MSEPFKTEDERHNDRVMRELAIARRLDRLCVIAAGILSTGTNQFGIEDIAKVSRAILAKLEEE